MPYFPEGMPVPVADALTEPYWAAAREHRLVVQRCTACGTFRHLPHEVCGRCQSTEHEWVESAGRGSIYTYTIAGHPVHEALTDSVPYNVAIVQLDDCGGVLVPSNLVDCPVEDIAVGLRVELAWEDVAEGVSVPRFRVVEES
jgi:uncharacterized OB-fold protein